MKKLLIAFVLLGLGLGITAQAADSSLVTTAGTHHLVLPGTEYRYTLVIPEGYTGREAVPFILSLHFGGEVTPYYGGGLLDALIEPALNSLGAIIIAPDNVDGGWGNANAEKHIFEFVDYIQANYNTDTNKTAIVGVSMGGAGTWYIAPRYPERFKVAIPISGNPELNSSTRDWETPLYIIHSADDEIVDIAPTAKAVAELQAKGESVVFVKVNGPTHFEFSRLMPQLEGAVPWILEKWAE